jgi:hypothetical protein
MGYTTDFQGRFSVTPALADNHAAYLKMFAETRRMARNADIAKTLPDPVRQAAGLAIGPEGAFFVGGTGFRGQDSDASVVDSNGPPLDQPGLWCQWVPTEDNQGLEWNEGEKFYSYGPWLSYLIDHFLKPWGYEVDGHVSWEGESQGDVGVILVSANEVSLLEGQALRLWKAEEKRKKTVSREKKSLEKDLPEGQPSGSTQRL